MLSSVEIGRAGRLRSMAHATARIVAPIGISHHSNGLTGQEYDAADTRSPQVSQHSRAFPLHARTRYPGDFTALNLKKGRATRQWVRPADLITLWRTLGSSCGPTGVLLWTARVPRCGEAWGEQITSPPARVKRTGTTCGQKNFGHS